MHVIDCCLLSSMTREKDSVMDYKWWIVDWSFWSIILKFCFWSTILSHIDLKPYNHTHTLHKLFTLRILIYQHRFHIALGYSHTQFAQLSFNSPISGFPLLPPEMFTLLFIIAAFAALIVSARNQEELEEEQERIKQAEEELKRKRQQEELVGEDCKSDDSEPHHPHHDQSQQSHHA